MPQRVAAFISIPKCATKTLLRMFELGRNRDDDRQNDTPIIYENHQRLCVMEQRYNLDNVFLFTFVRHPYDRVISWYYYHKRQLGKLSLEAWVQQGCPHHWHTQNATHWAREKKTPLLQCNFTESPQGRHVDFIGRMEHFEHDVKRLATLLNAKLEATGSTKRVRYTPMRVNASRQRPRSVILSDATKQKIYALFRPDFDTFGYKP